MRVYEIGIKTCELIMTRFPLKSSYYNINRQKITKVGLFCILPNKRQRIPTGQSKMDNPEKVGKYGTQDEEKQNKNTTQYVLDITISKQTQNNVNKT